MKFAGAAGVRPQLKIYAGYGGLAGAVLGANWERPPQRRQERGRAFAPVYGAKRRGRSRTAYDPCTIGFRSGLADLLSGTAPRTYHSTGADPAVDRSIDRGIDRSLCGPGLLYACCRRLFFLRQTVSEQLIIEAQFVC